MPLLFGRIASCVSRVALSSCVFRGACVDVQIHYLGSTTSTLPSLLRLKLPLVCIVLLGRCGLRTALVDVP